MFDRVDDLRESVAVYRDSGTSETEREQIRVWWAKQDIPNQFAAMLAAALIEKEN